MPIVFPEQTAASVATPSTGKVAVFVDSATGDPSYKDDTGTATTLKGVAGPGVPTGGTSGQVLAKIDGTNYNTQWVAAVSYTGTAGSITLTGSAFSIAATYVGQTSITTLGTIATGTWNATAISAVNGGTGQTGYAVGDLLYASTTTALSKLTAGTNGHVLTLAAGVPTWAAASASVAWGAVTGTLSSQTDLQTALDAKAPLSITQNSQSTAYTLVLSDAGKHILHPSADTTARIFTIPANSSVAFPVGTAVTFVNQNAGGVITIAITTDTMRLAGAGTTGSRTLAANGIATALKVTSTEWIINGTGLS